jgi:hypothetical protein
MSYFNDLEKPGAFGIPNHVNVPPQHVARIFLDIIIKLSCHVFHAPPHLAANDLLSFLTMKDFMPGNFKLNQAGSDIYQWIKHSP